MSYVVSCSAARGFIRLPGLRMIARKYLTGFRENASIVPMHAICNKISNDVKPDEVCVIVEKYARDSDIWLSRSY